MIKKTTIFSILVLFLLSPVFVANVFAAEQTGGPMVSPNNQSRGTALRAEIENPLGKDTTLTTLIQSILQLIARIGAVICVFFIIYSGFLFIKAQGNESELTKAKSVFLWSVVGTAVLLGASVIAELIQGTVKSVIGK